MRRNADGLRPPIAQAIKGTDAKPPKTGLVSSLGSFESPIEIPVRARGMHFCINRAIIGFLVNDKAFSPGLHEWPVFLSLHGPNFQREARHFLVQLPDAVCQVAAGNELR